MLEVLVATVLLGLLAVAVVPLTSSLISDHNRMDQARLARAWLLAPEQPLTKYVTQGLGVVPLQTLPGCYVHIHLLTPIIPPPQPGASTQRPDYQWARVDVSTQPSLGQGVLASRFMMVPRTP